MGKILHKALSEAVIGAAFAVHNSLGEGLLESAYEGAMMNEFKYRGISVRRQVHYPVYHRGERAGSYVADMVVDGRIILELKSTQCLSNAMEAQLINYLRLSGLTIGYLLNFRNERLEFRRRVLSR